MPQALARRIRSRLLPAAWLVLVTHGLGAQQTPPVFKTGTDLVTLTATVVDGDGRPVPNLRQEDFTIFEDGTRREMAFFQSGETLPVTLVIAIDTSGSMVDKLDDVRDAVEHLLDRADPTDEVFLLEFNDGVDLLVESAAPRDRRLRNAIDDLRSAGSTALYDAVIEGLEAAQRGRHRKKVLLVVTDGNDTSSRARRRQAVDYVKRSEGLVYCLGIGHGARGSFGHGSFGQPDRVDIDTLMDLAEPNGGRAYHLEEAHRAGVDRIDEAVIEIGRELRQQYTFGYYPAAADSSNSYRRIRVETTDRRYKVRTRQGYWPAPKKTSE